jgi:hypothetical protein
VYLETGVREGSQVDYTIDLFTGIGSVILVHKDKEVLDHDVAFIRNMEKENKLFEIDYESGPMKSSSFTNNTNVSIAVDRPDMY